MDPIDFATLLDVRVMLEPPMSAPEALGEDHPVDADPHRFDQAHGEERID
jgi:hypothetical protein